MKNKTLSYLVISLLFSLSTCVIAANSMQALLEESLVLRHGLSAKEASSDVDGSDEKLDQADFSMEFLSDGETQRLFLKSFLGSSVPTFSLLDADGIEKLAVLVGASNNRQACLANVLPTQTAAGSVQASCLLAQPLVSIDDLVARQNVVKDIAQNHEAYELLQSGLRHIAQGEKHFALFLKESSRLEKEATKRVFWGDRLSFLNSSACALGTLRTVQNISNLSALLFLHSTHFVGPYLQEYMKVASWKDYAKLIFGVKAPWKGIKSVAKMYARTHTPWRCKTALLDSSEKIKEKHFSNVPGVQKFFVDRLTDRELQGLEWRSRASEYSSLGDKIYEAENPHKTKYLLGAPIYTALYGKDGYELMLKNENNFWCKHPILNRTSTYALYLAWDAVVYYFAKRSYDNMMLDSKIITLMQEKLIGVAHIVRGMESIKKAYECLPELQNCLKIQHVIGQLFDSVNGDVASMVSRLQTDTFASDPSYFSNFVRILATYNQVVNHKDIFVDALAVAGELDAYCAASKLINNNSSSSAAYCFAHFVENDQAQLYAKNFWNPLMEQDKAIVNTMDLGCNQPRMRMITGPNGSGKSVMMNAFAYNTVLAQTFGIAAASEFSCTPFAYVNVYRNIQENLQEDLSTFMAESLRLEQLCRRIKLNNSEVKSLTFVDEGLKGTVEQEGGTRIYEVAKDLGQHDHNITFFATHFYNPTKLGDEQPDVCENVHMRVDEPEVGQFERKFEVVSGINRLWFEDNGWRSRFVNWLRQRLI